MVNSAVHWATERTRGIVLSPSDMVDGSTVMDALRQKHPAPCPPDSTSLLRCDSLSQLRDVEITGGHILYAAQRIQKGAGPGGCDACHWHDALLHNGAHSTHLRDAVATLARQLANSVTPWSDVCALVLNCLIALDKCPGVRPIGIGETLRHIIGKAICSATRAYIESLCGVDQASPDWGVLLVDAFNAFNSLNRAALAPMECLYSLAKLFMIFLQHIQWPDHFSCLGC